MKRDILTIDPKVCGCCPGHDTFPNHTYNNRRSKRARSRDIKREHRMFRRVTKTVLIRETMA